MGKTPRSLIGVFLLIYLALSAVLFIRTQGLSTRLDLDSLAYIKPAKNYISHGSFYGSEPNPKCKSHYPIGYPAFIAMAWSLLGQNNVSIVMMQILLAVLIILLIFNTTLRLFNRDVATIATLLACINVGMITYPQFILSEILACFLVIAGFNQLVAFFDNGSLFNLTLSGLFYGLSIIVKSAAWYYLFFLSILIFIFKRGLRFKSTAIFLIAFLVPVGGYVLRNKSIYGYYHLKIVDRINLYHYLLPKILIDVSDEDLDYNEVMKDIRLKADYTEYASGKGWERQHDLFIKTVKKYPLVTIKIWIQNVIKTLFGLYTNHLKVLIYKDVFGGKISFFKFKGGFLSRVTNYITAGGASSYIVAIGIFEMFTLLLTYIGMVIGFVAILLKRDYLRFLLLSSYIGYFAAITGHDGCARFRFMFDPALMIIAAFGFWVVYNYITNSRRMEAI